MKTVGVLFGGQSGEHEVSLVSAVNLINSISKEQYNVAPILIEKSGAWKLYKKPETKVNSVNDLNFEKNISISDIKKTIDVMFMVIHGETGEDGKLQGLFDILGIKYVGCNLETSAIGMNKEIAKKLVSEKVPVSKGLQVSKRRYNEETIGEIESSIPYPLFVKPVRAGSSLGANKANNREELIKNIDLAFEIDDSILIEEFVDMIELEVAIFEDSKGNTHVSDVGHIHYTSEFYDYESKYVDDTSEMIIPAKVEKNISEKIKEYALDVKDILGVKDYSRIDFFYDSKNGRILFNEINTSPGMTNKSMYPFLFKSKFEFEYIVSELIKRNMHD